MDKRRSRTNRNRCSARAKNPHRNGRKQLTGPPGRLKLTRLANDPLMEKAVLEMNHGRSLTAAARAHNIPRERLKEYLLARRLIRRKGRRWVIKDTRARRVPLIVRGRVRATTVAGFSEARLVSEHHQAAAEFVRRNDRDLLTRFEGQAVRGANGRRYPLETDPNEIHRIAAMDTPAFHEIYEIASSS